MKGTILAERHPNDGLIRVERLPHIWCPGCGLGNVIGAFGEAILASGDNPDDHVVVSGIGCTGRAAGYINVDSYHSTHGRAIPFATGIKLTNPKLQVSVISGDGDLSTIGGNHIIHAARRNLNLTIIFVNNFIYGMTGGQYSATTPHNFYSSTSQQGNYEHPFNMPLLMKASGATFIARWTSLHVKQLQASIEKAFKHDGFSFIEVISPCPTSFGKRNKFRQAVDSMKHYEDHSIHNDLVQLDEAGLTAKPEDDMVIGEFFASEDKLGYSSAIADFLKLNNEGGK